jgi:tetratricopeptide (TPR) repeat protein
MRVRDFVRLALSRALFPAVFVLAFASAQNGTAPIVIDYPDNDSVFPPDMTAPTFLWRDPAPGAVSWQIDISFADGSAALHVASKGERMEIGEIDPRCISGNNKLPTLTPEQAAAHTWKPDPATWAAIKNHSITGPATVTISGIGGAGKYRQPVSRGQMLMHTSMDPVGAPIFYRDVPLMPSKSEDGVIRPLAVKAIPLIKWRLRNVAERESKVLLENMPTCANCHSFARDGSTLGMDLDGPDNDKGLYALTPVQKQMRIGTEDEISWTSFKGELGGQLREGFMSQVSPDGRHVVTTVRPPGSSATQFYYVANFEDYRFLQVFYPTRGILVWYDRDTKKLQPLPGADDPNFVQANATWSPDGKYLVFARAVAKDPVPPSGKMATYATDPAETPIQYDLYRIPFNDGKGGKAEPIAGASANGMSNSFAKISPDGRWIVFVQAHNGLLMRPDSKLYVVPAAGGEARLLKCNTSLMNSWHSFSPNGHWLVFSSKSRTPYTQMFLTHIDADGNDSPAILIENSTAANRAVNIPEFVNTAPDGIDRIDVPATDFYRQFEIASGVMKKGDYATAIVEWTRALAMSNDDARAWNNFGVSLAGAGRSREAVAKYEQALVLRPNYPEAHDNLGNAFASQGRLDDAIAEYRKALEIDRRSADAHNNLGTALMSQGHLPDAIAQFESALATRPDYAQAHNNLGSALAAENNLAAAVPHFRTAIEIDPAYVDAYNNLGAALARQGKLEEATVQMRKAVELKPGDARAATNLGRALLAQGKVDEAILGLEKAISTSTETADLETTLGMALGDRGQIDQAIPHFEKAVALDPANRDARASLGRAYADTAWTLATSPDAAVRNGGQALRFAQQAAELSGGKDGRISDVLAAAYAENGQFAVALETARRAQALAMQESDAALAAEIGNRIALYIANQPFRVK